MTSAAAAILALLALASGAASEPPPIPPPPAGVVDPTVARIVAGACVLAALAWGLLAWRRARRADGPPRVHRG